MMDPSKLSPKQQQTVSARLGVTGWKASVIDTVTDPFVLFGLLTSFVFPLPTVENLSKLGKKLRMAGVEGGMLAVKRTPQLFWGLRTAESNLSGTLMPDLIREIARVDLEFQTRYQNKLAEAISKYQKAGRTFDHKTDVTLGALLDGLHEKAPSGWSDVFGKQPFLQNTAKLRADKPLWNLYKDFRVAYDDIYKEVYRDPRNQATIKQAVKRFRGTQVASLRKELRAAGVAPDEITKILKQEWGKAVTDKEMEKKLVGHPEELAHYLNHVPKRGDPMGTGSPVFQTYLESRLARARAAGDINTAEMIDEALSGRLGKHAGPSLEGRTPSSAMIRRHKMLPHIDDVKLLESMGLVSKTTANAYRSKVSVGNYDEAVQRRSPRIGMYTLSSQQAAAEYIHELGKFKGWTLSGFGSRLVQQYQELDPVKDAHLRKLMEEFYFPAMLGQFNTKAYNRQAWFQDKVMRFSKFMEEPYVQKMLGAKTAEKWKQRALSMGGTPIIDPLTRRASDMLYTNTLGFNLGSSAKNLFQMLLTSGPMLGPKAMMKGIASYSKRFETFAGEFVKTRNSDAAFAKAFPEYVKSGIPGSLVMDDTFYRLKEAVLAGKITGTTGKVWERFRRAAMFPFSITEKTNRAITFEAARLKALGEKTDAKTVEAVGRFLGRPTNATEAAEISRLTGQPTKVFTKDDYAIHLAGKAVSDTQFLPGPADTPTWLLNKGPLTRMFMHFPLRYWEFISPGGTLARQLAPGEWKNPLTGASSPIRSVEAAAAAGVASAAGRALLWSGLTAHAAHELLGVNLDESLMPGALPLPGDSREVLSPLPLRPPMWSLLASAAQDVSNWEFNQTRYALPMLFPAGVAASRAIGLVPGVGQGVRQGAAEFLNRKYVDYGAPAPDGRYAMYTGDNNLVGYMSPAQLFFTGTGILEKGRAVQDEQSANKFLLKNREVLRNATAGYVEAIMQNNMDKAGRMDLEFQQQFGTSLRNLVSKDMFKRYRQKREVSRLERLLDTMPPELRPQYAQSVQLILMNEPDMLGIDVTSGMTALQRREQTFTHQPSLRAGTIYPGTWGTQPPMGTQKGVGSGGRALGKLGQSSGDRYQESMGPLSGFNPYDASFQGPGSETDQTNSVYQTMQFGAGGDRR